MPEEAAVGTEPVVQAVGVSRSPSANPVLNWFKRSGGLYRTILSLIAGFGLWEIVGRTILTNRLFFVPFSDAMDRVYEMARDGDLNEHIWVSSQEFLLGYAFAMVAGIILGIMIGLSRIARDTLGLWVDIFNSTPVIALAPIFILIWGIGLTSKIALITFFCVWPIALNTAAGFAAADASLIEMVRSFGANQWQLFRTVRVPYALPFIAVGLRLAVGRGVVGVVIGELFGSRAGLGYLLFESKDTFDTAAIYGTVIILATIALIGVFTLRILEKRLAPWRTSTGEG